MALEPKALSKGERIKNKLGCDVYWSHTRKEKEQFSLFVAGFLSIFRERFPACSSPECGLD